MPADFNPPDSPQPLSSISYFPYFDSTYLAVAASLNGGNVLATFVEMLTSWMRELGLYSSSSSFYNQLIRWLKGVSSALYAAARSGQLEQNITFMFHTQWRSCAHHLYTVYA